jgi:hypothetical protein
MILSTIISNQWAIDSFGWIVGALALSALLTYFILLGAFGSMTAVSWRNFMKQWGKTVQKIHRSGLVFVLNSLAIATMGYLVAYSTVTQKPFWLMLLIFFILIVVIVFARLMWIASAREINHETDHH